MVKLKIKVTKEILKQSVLCGTNKDFSSVITNCAVARAVREIWPNALVAPTVIYIYSSGVKFKVHLPMEAIYFIRRFDTLSKHPELRLLMKEIEFVVDVPEELINEVNIDEIKELLKESTTLQLIES